MECEIRVLAARFVGTGRLQVRRPERCTLVHHSMFREYRLPDGLPTGRHAGHNEETHHAVPND
jgi:hypothetical protein